MGIKKYNNQSDLLASFPRDVAGIYSVTGGRQVGKTTLLKQWMALLLQAGINPSAIVYLTGELIDDHHSLVRLAADTLDSMSHPGCGYLLIDEVTYIREWDKGVKYLADAGLLEKTVLMNTGSDTALIRDARMRFPDRRGTSEQVDFHLHPFNFQDCVKRKALFSTEELETLAYAEEPDRALLNRLLAVFEDYLCHGGFLTAMNDIARHRKILPATFATYSDWIRGDILKRHRRELYLREILGAVIKRYGSQITWNSLTKDLSIDHPKTVIDYIELLGSMDAVFVQSPIREDKLTAAPKKAKKVMFTDPFILHAVNARVNPVDDPYSNHCRRLMTDEIQVSKLVEAVAVTQYHRRYPTFYIKAAGEVDIAYVAHNRLWPVEVKWTPQLRPSTLKQIVRYPNSKILTRRSEKGSFSGIPTEPLPLTLFRLGVR